MANNPINTADQKTPNELREENNALRKQRLLLITGFGLLTVALLLTIFFTTRPIESRAAPISTEDATKLVSKFRNLHLAGTTSFLIKKEELLKIFNITEDSGFLHVFYGKTSYLSSPTLVISGTKKYTVPDIHYQNTHFIINDTPNDIEHVYPCHGRECDVLDENGDQLQTSAKKDSILIVEDYPDNRKH